MIVGVLLIVNEATYLLQLLLRSICAGLPFDLHDVSYSCVE